MRPPATGVPATRAPRITRCPRTPPSRIAAPHRRGRAVRASGAPRRRRAGGGFRPADGLLPWRLGWGSGTPGQSGATGGGDRRPAKSGGTRGAAGRGAKGRPGTGGSGRTGTGSHVAPRAGGQTGRPRLRAHANSARSGPPAPAPPGPVPPDQAAEDRPPHDQPHTIRSTGSGPARRPPPPAMPAHVAHDPGTIGRRPTAARPTSAHRSPARPPAGATWPAGAPAGQPA